MLQNHHICSERLLTKVNCPHDVGSFSTQTSKQSNLHTCEHRNQLFLGKVLLRNWDLLQGIFWGVGSLQGSRTLCEGQKKNCNQRGGGGGGWEQQQQQRQRGSWSSGEGVYIILKKVLTHISRLLFGCQPPQAESHRWTAHRKQNFWPSWRPSMETRLTGAKNNLF